eukprot:COSAG06_NODE_4356_length_4332_cov_2.994330_4_plen_64_part_00
MCGCVLYCVLVQCYAPCPGIFKALVDQGDIFKTGDVIAQLGELDGSIIGEILAPIDGNDGIVK